METMGLPCGKELGSSVHALRGRGDWMNRLGMIENVPMFGPVEARLCTTLGGRFDGTRQCANGDGNIDAQYVLLSNGGRPHTVGKRLPECIPARGLQARGTQGIKFGWLVRVGSHSPTCALLGYFYRRVRCCLPLDTCARKATPTKTFPTPPSHSTTPFS